MTAATLAQAERGITAKVNYSAADVVAVFLSQLDAMPQTITAYKYNLRPFVSWLEREGIAIDAVKAADILEYKRYLMETHKPSTVNAYVTSVRKLFSWLESMTGYTSPARAVKGVRGANKSHMSKAHDALSHSQARAIAQHEGDGVTGLRDRAMINLMLVCALRTIEVTRLNVGNYRQMGTARIIEITGKGHAEADTFKVVDERVARLLDSYLKTRGKVDAEDPLFASTSNRNKGGRMTTRAVNGIVKGVMQAEGIDSPRLSAHSLRHSAITYAVESGATLLEAQTFARHEDPRTTEIYIHVAEALRGACEGYVASVLA